MFNNQRFRSSRISSLALLLASLCAAQENRLPSELEGVGVDEKIGSTVNLDLEFTAENGYQQPLRSFFKSGKPVVLNLVYYRCPMLCNLVLNAQTKVMKQVAWTAGAEYDVVTISIDPQEGFNLAQAKKKWYIEQYGREQASSGWHFLTDYQGNAKRLADQVGFRFRWDFKTEQWAHAAVIMMLTPEGRISRYLYGLDYKPRDMRLALTEASEGRLGTVGDRLLLFCFHYDPVSRSYVPFAKNLMKLGGVVTVLVMGMILSFLWRRERRRTVPAELPDGVATAK
ncbi:MAG TPA: SCO family protein [Bryobacteraceae bacterium]|nr:SCO family protein [Bryobacteraceae bacterium]